VIQDESVLWLFFRVNPSTTISMKRSRRECSRDMVIHSSIFKNTKWLFTRCSIENLLGLFPCVEVTSHLKCIRSVSVRFSLSCINIGKRIELTLKITKLRSLPVLPSYLKQGLVFTMYYRGKINLPRPATVNTRVCFGCLSSMERSLMNRSGIWDRVYMYLCLAPLALRSALIRKVEH